TVEPVASATAEASTPVEPPVMEEAAPSLAPAVTVAAHTMNWPLMAEALGGVGAVAAGAVVARRRFRRSLKESPVSDELDVAMTEGFADADTSRSFKSRVAGSGADPLQLLAEQALSFIGSQGLQDVALIAARQGRSSAG